MARPGAGGPKELAEAVRSVRVEPVMEQGIFAVSQQVKLVAMANLRSVPGTFSRSKVKLTLQKRRSVQAEGLLALVAEYGMGGRGWSNFHGGKVFGSPIPPPRAVKGRPGPEDGHVIGKAYKQVKDEVTEFMADTMFDEYLIQFDRKRIYKVGAG